MLGSATTLFGAISATGGQDWASCVVVAIRPWSRPSAARSDVFQPAAIGQRHQLLEHALRDVGWRALDEDWSWSRFHDEVVVIQKAFPSIPEADIKEPLDKAREAAREAASKPAERI